MRELGGGGAGGGEQGIGAIWQPAQAPLGKSTSITRGVIKNCRLQSGCSVERRS